MATESSVANNNKRMLKNTFVLYVRMALTMGVGFFTTRELLVALGVVDFGLANVIGSVVLMFSFLSGTMQATVSRFLSIDIGLKDVVRLRQTFSLTLLIYFFLVVLILALSETVGLWFFENKLVVLEDRKAAAHWFYQFSIVSFFFNVLSIPYASFVISQERIKAYAWIGSAESVGRLLIVFALYVGDYDRLALYGALLAIVSFFVFAAYVGYCYRSFPESRWAYYWDFERCKEMLLFALWNLWGALSGLFSNVFLNILLNSYFGPVVNAARGVAMQGATGVGNFVTNFLTAARPQIFKYYAEGNKALSVDLAIKSSRIGYFLLLLFSLPVLLEMPYVLGLWLKDVPEGAASFMRLILFQRLIEILAYPLVTLSQASGRVAIYQTVVGVLQWAVFPISWVFLELGFGAESVFIVGVGLSGVALVAQFYLIRIVVSEFSISRFVRDAVLPCALVSVCSAIIPIALYCSLSSPLLRFLAVCVSSFLMAVVSIYFIGLSGDERKSLRSIFLKKFGLVA